MLTKETIIDFIKTNHEHLRSDYRIAKIGLIGSFARDEQDDKSDIDILVEFEPNTEDLSRLKRELKQYFKNRFNRDVDVCREKYIKSYVKDDILKEAIYV